MRRGAAAGGRGSSGSRLRSSHTDAALQTRPPRGRSGVQVHLLCEPCGGNAWFQTGRRRLEGVQEVH